MYVCTIMLYIFIGITLGVVNLSFRSEITIVKFAPIANIESDKEKGLSSSQQPITIIGGCDNGSVHCVRWKSLTDYTTHKINR